MMMGTGIAGQSMMQMMPPPHPQPPLQQAPHPKQQTTKIIDPNIIE